jgi:DNA (cytosine-5)-methyltransferase 1
MKYLSLFSGIGGFELGIKQAYESIRNINVQTERGGKEAEKGKLQEDGQGLHTISGETTLSTSNRNNELSNGSIDEGQPTCIGFSEIDKYAIQIYEKHFKESRESIQRTERRGVRPIGDKPDLKSWNNEQSETRGDRVIEQSKNFIKPHHNYGDITKLDPTTLPDFDFLCGGFPCQAFSIAGKRGGFDDTRGTLFFDIARILKEKHPRLFLLENVKGLLSHDNGNTFKTIISTLTELGYDLQWQVLNSKNFGVPQNRERVFIIGHLRGTSRPQVFPFRESNQTPLRQLNQPKFSSYRFYGKDGISPTVKTMQGGNLQPKILEENMKIRRLTPIECERLQGFPDGWTEGISDTQRYKTLGNAVTVNVIQVIMEKLL